MAHLSLARDGLAAVEARRWDEALDKLSQALRSSANPAWLVARSKALVGLERFTEALADAGAAWHAAHERGNRALLIAAQYRRAVALYRMGRLADADCCCVYAMRLVEGRPAVEKDDPKALWADADGLWTATLQQAVDEARADERDGGRAAGVVDPARPRPKAAEWRLASTLRMQILRQMEGLPADNAARKVTVSAKPDAGQQPAAVAPATEAGRGPPAGDGAPPRVQEFQSATAMSVSIFSKGVDEARLRVDFSSFAVRLDPLVWPDGEERALGLRVSGEIDASASRYSVTANKVELRLAKKTPGKYQLLRAESEGAATGDAPRPTGGEKAKQADARPTPSSGPEPDPPAPRVKAPPASAPAYPSSSRSGPKDWGKIGDDEDEGDVNLFFKKLYKNATPEQQRAMMKSFTESNGTSLSTDWNDVKGRTVETVPPEGVQAKKWE